MKIGTRSLLFGYHQFLLHPLCVALAWWKLFGFPADIRLWVAFFVHDLGYWGKPNMDGPEGEEHPRLGAYIMHRLFDRRCKSCDGCGWEIDPYGDLGPQAKCRDCESTGRSFRWNDFALFHSRFFAKRYKVEPSLLCIADKYCIVLVPTWLQVLLMSATGEIHEYVKGHNGRTSGANLTRSQWVNAMKAVVLDWLHENGHCPIENQNSKFEIRK